MVKVKLFATFQEAAGVKKVKISSNNIIDLLKKLLDRYKGLKGSFFLDSDSEKLREGVNIMINGRNIRFLDGLSTSLEDNDTVAIFPPIAGG